MSGPGALCRQRPVRTCVGCGRRDDQSAMLKLKRTAAGGLVVASRSTGGRSAYLHDEPECLEGLLKSRRLARSLRSATPADARAEFVAARAAQK